MSKAEQDLTLALAESYEVPNDVVRTMPEPLVSVCTSAYQHAPFIAECIKGVLDQETSFPVEFLIGEDCSTDGTHELVLDLAARHPDRIRLFTADRNVGMRANARRLFNNARGRYIAYCEGDDYWIDPCKLQDQVDLLESDPGMSACITNAWNETDGIRKPFNERLDRLGEQKACLDLDDVLLENIAPTASLVFRKDRFLPRPQLSRPAPAGDWVVLVHMASRGRIGFVNRRTVVRRRHTGGRISQKDEVTKLLFTVDCIRLIREMVPPQQQAVIDSRVNALNRHAIEAAYQQGGRKAALQVWRTFQGRGFEVRQRLRWWMLLHCPGAMRSIAALSGRR